MSRRKSILPAALCGLAAGAAIFFIIESAVARYVGADLFLPVSGGVFLPGRLARLAACLTAGLALVVTDRGRAAGRALDRFCETDPGRWAISALMTGLLFLWTIRVSVLSFLISDDPVALRTIASMPDRGMEVGTHTFSNVMFCAMLSLFYRLAPDGYWYTIYHVGIQLLVLWLLGWCVLQKTSRRGWPAAAGCLIHAVFCAGVFSYTFAAVTFTLTAAVTGTGAVMLMLCRNDRRTRAGRIASDAGSAVLMLLCSLHRSACGEALFCFWFLAAGYQAVRILLERDMPRLRRIAALLLAVLLTVGLVDQVKAAAPVKKDPQYRTAEAYRSRIEDYLMDRLEDEHFQAAGISRELSSLLRYWYFMDENVTTETFMALEKAYNDSRQAGPDGTGDQQAEASSLRSRIGYVRGLADSFISLTASEPMMLQLSALALALLAGCLAAFWRAGLRRWPELLTAACAVGGSLILSLYLIRRTYFPLRAFQVIMFPAATTLLLMLLSGPEPAGPVSRSRRRWSGALWLLCAAAAAGLCGAGVYLLPHATAPDTRADVFGTQWAVEEYARENGDITIINNAYDLIFDPIHRPSDYPANLIWWGACGDTAKPPEERLYADTFFRDDVQFMTKNAPSVMFLLQYLSLDHGPVQAVTVTRLTGGVCVYDIAQVRPDDPDYTGWYECNGLTYYFRDGEPVSGTQTIDGEEYSFVLPGADSQFLSCMSQDSLAYSTYSYSLVTADP